MSSKIDEMDWIERYFANELDDSELEVFKRRFEDSKEFSNKVRLTQTILSRLETDHITQQKKELRNIYEHVQQEIKTSNPPKTSTFQNKYLYWAAAAIITVVITSIFVFAPKEQTSNELFLGYYEPYPASPDVRGEKESLLNQTMELYRTGNYKDATPGFIKYLEENNDERIFLFLGNCYLNSDQFPLAKRYFTLAEKSNDLILSQHGSWYIVLSNLKENNISSAKEKLNFILMKGQSQLYYEEAASLQKLLDK